MSDKREGFLGELRPHAIWWVIEVLIAFLIPASFVAYLEHVKSDWTSPVLAGLGAGVMSVVIWAAIRGISQLPPKRVQPNSGNIESCVRRWLDNHKIAVKNDPAADYYFRVHLTLDSGVHATVYRSKTEYSDYIQIVSDLGVRGDSKKLLEQFTIPELNQIIWNIKVELARARCGYGGLTNPPENFHIFRRVPIHHNLTEFFFMSVIGDIEAAVNLVGLMFVKAQEEKSRNIKSPSTPAISAKTR